MSTNFSQTKLKHLQQEEKVLRKLISLVNDQISYLGTEGYYLQYHLGSSDNPTGMPNTSTVQEKGIVNEPVVTLEDPLNLEVDATLKSYSQSINCNFQEMEEN